MLGTAFYHSTTRNLVIAVGNLFNNIWLVRKKADGTEAERLKVPIEYGPKQKWWVVMKEDPANLKRVRIKLPRIGFEITNLSYDSSRKLQIVKNFHGSGNPTSTHKKVYTGTPYNFTFEVNIITENSDDGFQVLEQILPFFQPTFTVTVNSLPSLNHKDDVPVTLQSVQKVDEYEDHFDQLRIQTFGLVFGVRSFIYGPITDQKIITRAQVDTHVVRGTGPITAEEIESTPRHIRTVVTPDPPNATAESDFGFTTVITEYDDDKHYNPVTGTDVLIDTDITVKPSTFGLAVSIIAPTVTL